MSEKNVMRGMRNTCKRDVVWANDIDIQEREAGVLRSVVLLYRVSVEAGSTRED